MTLQVARVLSGDAELLERAHRGSALTVLSGFERAVNLVAGDGLLWTLAGRDVPDGPGTLRVDLDGVRPLGLEPGRRVTVAGSELQLPTGQLVSLGGAEPWDPPLATPQPRPAHLAAARTTLATHGRPGGLLEGPSNDFAAASGRVLRQRFADLQLAVALGDSGRVAASVPGIVGLGVGLTPSGDDALAGFMVALSQVGGRGRDLLPARSAAALAQPTTAVSRAMLAAASRGRAVDPLHRLLLTLAGDDASLVSPAAEAVIALGHTSGTDLLCGLIAALDLHHEMRGTA